MMSLNINLYIFILGFGSRILNWIQELKNLMNCIWNNQRLKNLVNCIDSIINEQNFI